MFYYPLSICDQISHSLSTLFLSHYVKLYLAALNHSYPHFVPRHQRQISTDVIIFILFFPLESLTLGQRIPKEQ